MNVFYTRFQIYSSLKTPDRISDTVFSLTRDHAQKSSVVGDRFHCQKTLHRGDKNTFHSSLCSGSRIATNSKTEMNA